MDLILPFGDCLAAVHGHALRVSRALYGQAQSRWSSAPTQ